MAKINVRDRNKNTGRRPNWEYRFELATVGGKRHSASRSGYHTKKEALEAGTQALAEYYRGGEHFTPSTMSFSDYLDFWVENYGKNHWKATTLQGRVYIIERNIKPILGKYRLASITPSVLQNFINGYRSKSKSYITGILATIHVSFRCAVFPFGFLKTDPAEHVTPPLSSASVLKKEKEVVTKDDFQQIINKYPFGTTYYIPFMLGWHCGLRISETLGLTWDSVDFLQKTVTIKIQVNQLKNGGHPTRRVSSPKFESTRIIQLDDEMLQAFQKEYERQTYLRTHMGDAYPSYVCGADSIVHNEGEGIDMDFVCRNKYGEWISLKSLNHALEKVRLILGKRISYHSLRHSHATALLACGVHPKVIQQRLGHRRLSTTLDVYTHSYDEVQVQAMEKIQKFFSTDENQRGQIVDKKE